MVHLPPSQEERPPRILVGGVPFGRGDAGNEAILECIVKIVRRVSPWAEIAVSTDSGDATSSKLPVETIPLLGFDSGRHSRSEARRLVAEFDVYLWGGGTGLSEYPEASLGLLREAQDLGLETVIFCAAMNDRLDRRPAAGRGAFSTSVRGATLGWIDPARRRQDRRSRAVRELMRRTIPRADLVVMRDEESRAEVAKVLGTSRGISVAADPAILLTPLPPDRVPLEPAIRKLLRQEVRKIGLCLSPRDRAGLKALREVLDSLVAAEGVRLFGIPLDAAADREPMKDLRKRLVNRERFHLLEGPFEPDEIAGLVAEMDVVVSSSLPFLVVASNSRVPMIGFGSQPGIAHYVGQFDLPALGRSGPPDHEQLELEIRRLLGKGGENFRERCPAVLADMTARIEVAVEKLEQFLHPEPFNPLANQPSPWTPVTSSSS